MNFESRLNDMLERYGERCTQEKAAKILGNSSRTIRRMLEDGRLVPVGAGVDVRSIASYLINPRQHNYEARHQRRK